jgi:hypothetical protein
VKTPVYPTPLPNSRTTSSTFNFASLPQAPPLPPPTSPTPPSPPRTVRLTTTESRASATTIKRRWRTKALPRTILPLRGTEEQTLTLASEAPVANSMDKRLRSPSQTTRLHFSDLDRSLRFCIYSIPPLHLQRPLSLVRSQPLLSHPQSSLQSLISLPKFVIVLLLTSYQSARFQSVCFSLCVFRSSSVCSFLGRHLGHVYSKVSSWSPKEKKS